MTEAIVKDCTLPEQHPCTRGHFPGRPLVPGAYLLAQLAQLIEDDVPGQRLASIRKVKFLNPLAPGKTAQLHYRISAAKVQFSISSADGTILEGGGSLEPR